MILPRSGGVVAVIPEIGADLMRGCAVAEIRTWPAPVPGDDGLTLLADTLSDLVPTHGTIGLPMGAETSLRMPLADYMALAARLSPRRMVDATHTVQRMREIKSEAETQAIRAACRIADAAFAKLPERLHRAQSFADLSRLFQIDLLEAGADWVSYVAGGAGPGGYGNVIAPPGETPLLTGDIVML
ncbi:hypothetical protein LCGC14_2746780, partial [marine sediment metagenome]